MQGPVSNPPRPRDREPSGRQRREERRDKYLVGEAAHEHTVAGQLAHVAGAELPHLGGDAVLLHQRLLWKPRPSDASQPCTLLGTHGAPPAGGRRQPRPQSPSPSWLGCLADLGEVKLQGVISGQGDHEAPGQVLRQRVAVVAEEEAVVAERGHGNADLGQVVQVLQNRGLKAKGKGLSGGHQAGEGTWVCSGAGQCSKAHKGPGNGSDEWESFIVRIQVRGPDRAG